VERPEQYGGDLTYDDYESLADDLESGDLHPADAKGALADYLDELIAPGRAQIVES
jgi:tyrosyl-tRNA synthetase